MQFFSKLLTRSTLESAGASFLASGVPWLTVSTRLCLSIGPVIIGSKGTGFTLAGGTNWEETEVTSMTS